MKNIDELKSKINDELLKLKKGDFTFYNNAISLNLSLTDLEYKKLLTNAQEIGVDKDKLNELINEQKDELKRSFQPKVSVVYKLKPTDLQLGQHLKIITRDDYGEAVEELIFVGNERFILIGHERESLLIGDELKSISSPWSEGGVVDFEVYRNGKRFIYDDDHTIYRTRKILYIEIIEPQFDYAKLFSDENK